MHNNYMKNWFQICLILLGIVFIYIVQTNLTINRRANILIFCTKQYDDRSVLNSPNTYFGFPNECLNEIIKLTE